MKARKSTALTCNICKQPISTTLEARLYINGKATDTVADIHGQASKPAHPETLRGTGGPLVGKNDIWEWRVTE